MMKNEKPKRLFSTNNEQKETGSGDEIQCCLRLSQDQKLK